MLRFVFVLLLGAALAPNALAFGPALLRIIQCPDGKQMRRLDIGGEGFVSPWSWTDGENGSTTGTRDLSRCGPEGRVYRPGDATMLHETLNRPPSELPELWRATPRVEPTQARDLEEALADGMARSPGEELLWRLRLWWSHNEPVRRLKLPSQAINPFSTGTPAHQNLLRILTLLREEEESHQLTRAEVLREMERFEDALRVLDRSWSAHLLPEVQHLRELARAGIPWVRPRAATLKSMRELQSNSPR